MFQQNIRFLSMKYTFNPVLGCVTRYKELNEFWKIYLTHKPNHILKVPFWINLDSRPRNVTLTLVTWPWTWSCDLAKDHVTKVTWPSLCLQPYIKPGFSNCKLYKKYIFDSFHVTLTLILITWPKNWSCDLDPWLMDLSLVSWKGSLTFKHIQYR